MAQRLNSSIIKNALKGYIVPPFVETYNVCAVKAVWETCIEIHAKRIELENILLENEAVVSFFSCVTLKDWSAKNKGKSRKRRQAVQENDPFASESAESDNTEDDAAGRKPGISFWIVFNCPEITANSFAKEVIQSFVTTKVNLLECDTINVRGKTKPHFCTKILTSLK